MGDKAGHFHALLSRREEEASWVAEITTDYEDLVCSDEEIAQAFAVYNQGVYMAWCNCPAHEVAEYLAEMHGLIG
ncbi:hypothetical protein NDU88_007671 [Pleurodeles waltl]|uniref:Uncharacterized protein n=1 Tax=Pleurodeles waltl TaxID=8319 RepID=A0AAV7ST64_PLEWA|nr:hypothetical protein NDU88_007671 [Pleurodeles waltl]